MKRILKRKVLMVTLLAISIMLLTSCGTRENKKATGTNTDNAVDVSAPGELPIVKEKIELTIGIPNNANVQNFDTNEYTKWLEEQTNIDLKFDIFPSSGGMDKLQVMLASNSELPDVLIGFQMDDKLFLKYEDQGVFLALNDYIEEHGYWIKEMFEKTMVKDVKKYMRSANGKFYWMPYLVEQEGNVWAGKAWINKVWLDKLGLEVPTTTEEFRTVLKAFKTKDPNGNGKNDELGFTGSKNGWHQKAYDFLISSFIYNDHNNFYIVNEDGKADVAYDKDEWKEAMKYMNSLVQEDLFDLQSFTQDSSALKALAQNPDYNILGAFASGSPDALFSANRERLGEYVAIPPLKGPKGVAWAYKQPMMPRCYGVITKYCENPVAAFKLMDFMLSEESALRGRYGVPEKDWKYATENDICIFENIGRKALVVPILPYGAPQNSHWQSLHPTFRSAEISDGMAWNGDPLDGEYIKAKAITAYKDKAPEKIVSKLLFNIEESEEFYSLETSISAYVKEHIAMFITGRKNLENDWNDYIKELHNMGLDRYKELLQIGYERFEKGE